MLISRIGSSRVHMVAEAIRTNFLNHRFLHDISKYSFSNIVIDNWKLLIGTWLHLAGGHTVLGSPKLGCFLSQS